MNRPIVTFKDVSVRFGEYTALKDINFTVEDVPDSGEFIAIVGPSGCGKSTLINVIAGFINPAEGQALIGDRVIDGPGMDRGMIFQKYSLFPHLTVMDNVLFGLNLNRGSLGISKSGCRELAKKMIERVELTGHEMKYPHQLSGGQQQRVAIARTLVLKPRIILMDEPFSALDEPTRIEMQKLIVQLWYEVKPTVFAITHSVSEAVYLAQRVWIMTKGPGRIAYDIRDCIPPTVGEDPLAIQESPEFKRGVEVVGNCLREAVEKK
ncbi:MAG: ABC transporter ATP-binding protein [Candidatus Omnitrophota bacterium]